MPQYVQGSIQMVHISWQVLSVTKLCQSGRVLIHLIYNTPKMLDVSHIGGL